MRYRVDIVAYEPFSEIGFGWFEVEADHKARAAAKKLHPNLEDLEAFRIEVLKNA